VVHQPGVQEDQSSAHDVPPDQINCLISDTPAVLSGPCDINQLSHNYWSIE
jgi:hypothetical protein